MTPKLKSALLIIVGGLVGVVVFIFAYEIGKQVFGLKHIGARATGMFGVTFAVWFAYIFLAYPHRSSFWKKAHLVLGAVLAVAMLLTWDWKAEKFDLVFAGDPIATLERNKNCKGAGLLDNLNVVGDKLVNHAGIAVFSIREINDSKLQISRVGGDLVVMLDVEWHAGVVAVSSQLPTIGWKVCDR